ncbi:hypothetical protein NUW58_g3415 [Xylaria curta]|uniref:Uncharacterized protein n=1 Tax=Xylaria curta TaxID=42375 RepID=A0ACC1PB33_9PEZI|nr:hypothetical protein NUW58_g3415 [Xylaria curta]
MANGDSKVKEYPCKYWARNDERTSSSQSAILALMSSAWSLCLFFDRSWLCPHVPHESRMLAGWKGVGRADERRYPQIAQVRRSRDLAGNAETQPAIRSDGSLQAPTVLHKICTTSLASDVVLCTHSCAIPGWQLYIHYLLTYTRLWVAGFDACFGSGLPMCREDNCQHVHAFLVSLKIVIQSNKNRLRKKFATMTKAIGLAAASEIPYPTPTVQVELQFSYLYL